MDRAQEGDADPPLGHELRRRTRWVSATCLFVLVLAGLLASPAAVSADSLRSVFVGVAVYRHGTLDIQGFSPSWTMATDFALIRRPDGALLPFFPWAPSLFVVPFVAVADWWLRWSQGRTVESVLEVGQSTWPFEVLSMSVVVALTAVVVLVASRRLIALTAPGTTVLRREVLGWSVALASVFATSAWSTSSRSLWQHGPAALFVLLAFAGALALASSGARRPLVAAGTGAAAATAFTMRPTGAVLVVVLAAWFLLRHREVVLAAVGGGSVVAALFVWVNVRTYDAVLPPYFIPGSADTPYRTDLVQAAAANLVSPARGLLVYSPVLLAAVAGAWILWRSRSTRDLAALLVAAAVLPWLVVSSFPHWWGGFSYGPRFMSDSVPALVLLCVPVVAVLLGGGRPRLAPGLRPAAVGLLCAALVWSVVAHGEGALTRSAWCWNSTPDVNADPARVWDWSDAQVTAGIRGVERNGWTAETVRGGSAAVGCEGLVR